MELAVIIILPILLLILAFKSPASSFYKRGKNSINNNPIKVGDYIEPAVNEVRSYFKSGPLKVIKIEDNKPDYTGGKFVYVEVYGKEQGFYINAVKRVN